MPYKALITLLFLITTSCKNLDTLKKENNVLASEAFSNMGFSLLFNEELFDKKSITKKIDNRSLIIFQKNLKKGTNVKIKNILNGKYLIAKVGTASKYPSFYNSVISERIFKELELNEKEPYTQITEIRENSSFVANKAVTFDEEKNVANKAPIDDVEINNLNETELSSKNETIKTNFNYIIKIADFYFNETALSMKNRILNEADYKKAKIRKITATKYRVFLGPFNNINLLQKAFNDISVLQFENLEILKND